MVVVVIQSSLTDASPLFRRFSPSEVASFTICHVLLSDSKVRAYHTTLVPVTLRANDPLTPNDALKPVETKRTGML